MSDRDAKNAAGVEFEALRPRLLALLALHRAAQTEEARAALVELLERLFLAAAWRVAQDLVENGWSPESQSPPSSGAPRPHLKVVGGSDAA